MSRLGFVIRQIRADLAVALLLAAVLAVGAFLGAAAPPWIDDRLDAALEDTLSDAAPQGDLVARGLFGASVTIPPRTDLIPELAAVEEEIEQVRRLEPALTAAYTNDRWSLSLATGMIVAHEGPAEPSARQREIGLWLPEDAQQKVTVVEGRFPRPDVEIVDSPASTEDRRLPMPVFEVAATADVMEALELEVGDQVVAQAGTIGTPGGSAPALLAMRLSGVVEPTDRADVAWKDAFTALEADRGIPGDDPRIFRGTVIADPLLAEQLVRWATLRDIDWRTWLSIHWQLELQPERLAASDVEPMITSVQRLRSSSTWTTSLDKVLLRYQDSRGSAERSAALGVASLTGLLVTVLLLAVGLLAERRAGALALTRVRGGSDRVLARSLAVEALLVGVPAVAVGVLAAALLVDASGWIPGILLLVTVAGLPVVGVRLARRSGAERPEHATLRPSPRRLVAEAGLVVIAAAAVWLLSRQSAASGAGADPVVSFTPLLVAAATGVLVFRLLPYPVAAVARVVGRSRGATSFIATSRAARSPAYAVLPVIAVLMAVGLAAFGGTVQTTADRSREATAWAAVPADAVVTTTTLRAEADELGALIPEATAIADGYLLSSQSAADDRGDSVRIDVLMVDVPAWAEAVAGATEPVEPVTTLATGRPPGGAVPAVMVGQSRDLTVGQSLTVTIRGHEVHVQLLDRAQRFAGAPNNPAIVIPLDRLGTSLADLGLQWPNVVYLAGPVADIDLAALLGGHVERRADVLAAIGEDPMLRTTLTIFQIAVLAASALAAAAAVLGLQATARSRAYALSILRTLGMPSRSAATLIAAEVIPVSIMAALVGATIGLGVATIAGQAIDLAALTGLLDEGGAVAPDVAGTALAAAGVVTVVVVAVGIAIAANRRARLGAVLRVGERS
jgi:putative ABC transport system permease protein